MSYMFGGCDRLQSLDLSNFNTSKVTNMEGMFLRYTNLQAIYVGNGWSTTAVTKSDRMFSYCPMLKGSQGTAYDANHVDKTYARIDGSTSNHECCDRNGWCFRWLQKFDEPRRKPFQHVQCDQYDPHVRRL